MNANDCVLEYYREHMQEIDILADESTLFLLSLTYDLGDTTIERLAGRLGWSPEHTLTVCQKLDHAGMIRQWELPNGTPGIEASRAGGELLGAFYSRASEIPVAAASRVVIRARPDGLTAVYVAEVANERDGAELERLFQDLSPAIEAVQLLKGKLVSYAVRVPGRDAPQLEEIESFLKRNFGFVVLYRSLVELIYDVVRGLAEESGSELLPVTRCDICGVHDPFPAISLTFLDSQGTSMTSRDYCAACVKEFAQLNDRLKLLELLRADSGLPTLCPSDLALRHSDSVDGVAFDIRSDISR